MGAEVIEEQADLLVAVTVPQSLKPLLELGDVDGEVVDCEVLLASLLRDGREHSQGRLIQL